jgi:hypothetical protein
MLNVDDVQVTNLKTCSQATVYISMERTLKTQDFKHYASSLKLGGG